MRKLSRYCFLAFLFLLPVQTVWLLSVPMVGGEVFQYGVIGLYGTDLLLLGAAMLAFLEKGKWREIFCRRGATERILFLFFAFAALSVLWADDRLIAGFFVWKLALATLAFFLARSLSQYERNQAVVVLLSGAVIQSLLALWQFLPQGTFASTFLGMSFYDAWQPGVSVLKNELGRWLRAYGSLPHPNILGGFLATTLVIGIVYRVSGIKYEERIRKMFVSIGLVVILFGLLLTFSRSAWLGAVLGIAALSFFVWRSGEKRLRKNLLVLFGVLGVASIAFVSVLHETVFPRFDQATIAREGSVVDRAATMREGWTVIREHPLIGVGVGNYPQALLDAFPERPTWSIQPIHKVPLLIWAELGLVGVILFVAFMVSTVRKDISVVGLLALVPALLLDHYLWTSHFGLLFLFVLLGLVSRRDEEKRV